jgi:enoyl-CoA hydratase/carnithine racemase
VPDVTLELTGGVAVVTIDRPNVRNALGDQAARELGQALDEAEAADVGALVLRGAGDRAFVSGGDLKELSSLRDERAAIAMASGRRRLLDRLATFPVPVIAALNGHAVGGGAEVAVAADIRVAASDVTIAFAQVRLAVMPAWGGAERLAEIVGRSQALLLVGTGRTVDAEEAHRLGLVDVVVPRDRFDDGWLEIARAFAALPPGAARSIKSVVAAARPSHHPALEHDAVRHFARLWIADEHWQAAERRSG